MESLETILNALKKEFAVALKPSEPGEVKWEADRVVLTLALAVKKDAQGLTLEFARPEAPHSPNSISIEFKLDKNTTAAASAMAKTTPPVAKKLSGSAVDEVTVALSNVLGKPGFDSSARATVLREACENLSDEDAASVFRDVESQRSDSESPEVRHAHALIQRICRSGPAGSVEGRKMLADIFRRWGTKPVIHLIAETWKTQGDWLV